MTASAPSSLLFFFLVIIILLYFIHLFYKFISKEHLNEKGIHPFLWFAVR